MTAKKVVPLFSGTVAGIDETAERVSGSLADSDRPIDSALTAPDVLAAENALAAVEFEALLRLGRANGGLTQDDVVSVLESVELSADLIVGVVERIREAGIEFSYDTGESTIVPMVVRAEPGDAADKAASGPAQRPQPKVRLVTQPPDAGVESEPKKPGARKSRASTSTGFSEGDSFRGSAADPDSAAVSMAPAAVAVPRPPTQISVRGRSPSATWSSAPSSTAAAVARTCAPASAEARRSPSRSASRSPAVSSRSRAACVALTA